MDTDQVITVVETVEKFVADHPEGQVLASPNGRDLWMYKRACDLIALFRLSQVERGRIKEEIVVLDQSLQIVADRLKAVHFSSSKYTSILGIHEIRSKILKGDNFRSVAVVILRKVATEIAQGDKTWLARIRTLGLDDDSGRSIPWLRFRAGGLATGR